MTDAIKNRYDFVYFFDVKDGNPNGDPDAGNMPRIDPETGNGLVTDVCIKRKVRNFIQLAKGNEKGFNIYIKEKAVLGRAHVQAFKDLGISLGEEAKTVITKKAFDWFEENGIPDGLATESDEDADAYTLVVAADADRKAIKDWMKEAKPQKDVKDTINGILKESKSRRPSGEEVEQGRAEMCEKHYDIRTFGAVMSLKSAPNCGQVRGPIQLTFARSVDQIVPLEHSITRMAVATEAEAEKQQGDNRTMGRKFTVPYALYRCHGFISASLAEQTIFSTTDLELFWDALANMFEHDHSAARGQMSARKLIIFKHDSAMGNTPSHKLFDLVTAKADSTPVRDFSQYSITVPAQSQMPKGVTVIDKI